MRKIEKADIDRYYSFFRQLDYAILEAMKLSLYKSRQKLLNENSAKTDIHKAIYRAKKGLAYLDSIIFKKVVSILISSGIDVFLIDELKHSYELYYYINSQFTSKKSSYRGAGYLSRENAENKFNNLIESLQYTLLELTTEDNKRFDDFLDDAVEVPFSKDDARSAITNAYAITLFMGSNRDTVFGKVRDEFFFHRLTLSARLGAWTSQYVGQRGTFDYFLKVLEKAAQSRVRRSIIGYHAIRWHDAHWRRNIGLPYEDDHALKAFEALAEGRSISYEAESFDGTIILNAAHEAVRKGGTYNDHIQSHTARDYAVRDLMDKVDSIPIPGAYEVGSRLTSMLVKARSLVNANELEKAEEEVVNAWNLFHAAPNQSKMLKYKILFTNGIIEQAKTNKLDNYYLRNAYDIAVEVGAFHYAIETANLMGLR